MSAIVLILAALVANGGFEEGASSWRLGKKTCRIVPDAGLKSSSALVWENDDPKYYAYATQSFDIEPGCAYSFSGWIKDCGKANLESFFLLKRSECFAHYPAAAVTYNRAPKLC